jgi:hypothetical protein
LAASIRRYQRSGFRDLHSNKGADDLALAKNRKKVHYYESACESRILNRRDGAPFRSQELFEIMEYWTDLRSAAALLVELQRSEFAAT